MGNIAAIVLIISISLFIVKSKFAYFIGIKRQALLLVFFVHLFFGLTLTYIYSNFYLDRSLADTFKYFDDANHIFQLFKTNPKLFWDLFLGSNSAALNSVEALENTHTWFPESRRTFYNDNRTIVRINLIIRFFSFGSYFFHLIIFFLMGIIGKALLFKVGKSYLPQKEALWFLVIFFIPSIVFWSSGILKEGPLFLIMGYLIYQLHNLHQKGITFWNTSQILGLIICMIFIKFYVLIFMIPAILIFLQFKYLKYRKIKIIIFNFIGFLIGAQIWHVINPRWSVFTILKWKKNDFIGLAEVEKANSFISTRYLDDNLLSFLANIPEALLNSFIQPTFWNITNVFSGLTAIENFVLLIFMIFCVVKGRRVNVTNVGVFALIYALSFLTITAMITPIIGSLVRYKIPILPFLLFFFIQFLDVNKITSTINKLISKINKLFLL